MEEFEDLEGIVRICSPDDAIEKLNAITEIKNEIEQNGMCRDYARRLNEISPDFFNGYNVQRFTEHHSLSGVDVALEAFDWKRALTVTGIATALVAVLSKLIDLIVKALGYNKKKALGKRLSEIDRQAKKVATKEFRQELEVKAENAFAKRLSELDGLEQLKNKYYVNLAAEKWEKGEILGADNKPITMEQLILGVTRYLADVKSLNADYEGSVEGHYCGFLLLYPSMPRTLAPLAIDMDNNKETMFNRGYYDAVRLISDFLELYLSHIESMYKAVIQMAVDETDVKRAVVPYKKVSMTAYSADSDPNIEWYAREVIQLNDATLKFLSEMATLNHPMANIFKTERSGGIGKYNYNNLETDLVYDLTADINKFKEYVSVIDDFGTRAVSYYTDREVVGDVGVIPGFATDKHTRRLLEIAASTRGRKDLYKLCKDVLGMDPEREDGRSEFLADPDHFKRKIEAIEEAVTKIADLYQEDKVKWFVDEKCAATRNGKQFIIDNKTMIFDGPAYAMRTLLGLYTQAHATNAKIYGSIMDTVVVSLIEID